MGSSEGKQLSELIRRKVGELAALCEGLDEATASHAPSGRWSPKQILSHVCGPESGGLASHVDSILNENTPRIDLEPGNPFFTGERTGMTFAGLLSLMRENYGRVAERVEGLTEEQLARKAYVPMFKDFPPGEYPTLAVFVTALTEHHLDFHIAHMKEILEALGQGS